MPENIKQTGTQLHRSRLSRVERKTATSLIGVLNMHKFKNDPERENEILWGDKEGYQHMLQKKLSGGR